MALVCPGRHELWLTTKQAFAGADQHINHTAAVEDGKINAGAAAITIRADLIGGQLR